MPSKLKRVSTPAEERIAALADREDRTFVAQLDRVIDAGLRAIGEPGLLADPQPTPAPETKGKRTKATTRG